MIEVVFRKNYLPMRDFDVFVPQIYIYAIYGQDETHIQCVAGSGCPCDCHQRRPGNCYWN